MELPPLDMPEIMEFDDSLPPIDMPMDMEIEHESLKLKPPRPVTPQTAAGQNKKARQ
jgi:hypothetical protein